jgi:GNAT superfamily N-acetyltransferase
MCRSNHRPLTPVHHEVEWTLLPFHFQTIGCPHNKNLILGVAGMKIRQAVLDDALEISSFLEQLASLGKRNLPSDPDFVRSHYIAHPDTIQCAVAQDEDGTLLGLQILKIASEGNVYGVDVGWGIIGTHVKPSKARQGVGKTLFAATLQAAKEAGLSRIDATIGATNFDGISYYDAIGFDTYRTPDSKICKCFKVTT